MVVEALEDRLVPAVFNVNSLADILNPAAGTVTLRSAIQAANSTPGGNTINLTLPGTYAITLPGTTGETDNAAGEFAILPAGGNLKIVNTSGGKVIVDGNHLARVFDINPNFDPNNPTAKFTVTMRGFTIQNGDVTDAANADGPNASGGGIRDQGNASLTLNNMTLTNNIATADGGGLSMENTVSVPWTLTLNNTVVSHNHAGDAGGGIDTDGSGKIFINNSVITGNSTVNQGGGIWLDAIQSGADFQGANLTVTGTVVSGNSALSTGTDGGGIGNAGNGTVTISNSTLSGNFSQGTGGGFGDANAEGTLIVQNSYFFENSSFANGGAIGAGGPTTTISNTEIKANSTTGSGGGIFANGNTLTVENVTLADNTAATGGGGIELQTTGTGASGSTITNTTISGNSALNNAGANGGGIDAPNAFTGAVSLLDDTINGNFATSVGGIFWSRASGSFALENTIVAGNQSPSSLADVQTPTSIGFTDNGGNLIGVLGTGFLRFGFTAPSTQSGAIGNPLDPLLGPLQYNGGPTTGAAGPTAVLLSQPLETEALRKGSPAIGHGLGAGAPTTDERGFQIPAGAAVDVGAFQTTAIALSTPNQRYVNAVYEILLHRPADAPGLAFWTGLLNQGVSPATIVLDIESSGEFHAGQVQSFFQHLLHRPADPQGLQFFVSALGHGATPEQVEEAIVSSPEYFQLHGGTNAGFVTALFQDVLNRQPDAGGLASFEQRLANGVSRGTVAALIFSSPEYLNDLVASDYQTLLGRTPDPTGAAGFFLALNSGANDAAVEATILGSAEAFARLT
jgi:CSLREA domain-containing protein